MSAITWRTNFPRANAPRRNCNDDPSDSGAIGASLNVLCPVAVGEGTLSLLGDNDAVAVGAYAEASGIKSIAIGGDCISGGTGGGTKAAGARSIAIGEGAGTGVSAVGADAICIGTATSTTTANAIAFGNQASTLTVAGNVSIGYQCATLGGTEPSLAVGYISTAVNGGIAIGDHADGETRGIAIGRQASADYSGVAIGPGAISANGVATNANVSIGRSATTGAATIGCVTIGDGAITGTGLAVAVGNLAHTTGVAAVAIGYGGGVTPCLAADQYDVAIGCANVSANGGGGNVGIGQDVAITGAASVYSIAMGRLATVTNVGSSIAIGHNASSTLAGGVALGYGATTSNIGAGGAGLSFGVPAGSVVGVPGAATAGLYVSFSVAGGAITRYLIPLTAAP